MRTFIPYFLLALCMTARVMKAQFSIALRTEIQKNYPKISDPGGHLRNTNSNSTTLGIDINYKYQKWIFSTGISSKTFHNLLRFENTFIGFLPNSALQVPLLLGKNIDLYNNKIRLCPFLGTNFLFFPRFQSNSTTTFFIPDSIIFTGTHTNVLLNKWAFTAVAGLQLNFQIHPKFSIGSYLSFNKGFINLIEQRLVYAVPGSSPVNATQADAGTYFSFWALRVQFDL